MNSELDNITMQKVSGGFYKSRPLSLVDTLADLLATYPPENIASKNLAAVDPDFDPIVPHA